MDSSGLKYKSMEELLSQSSLTEQQTRLYEKKSLDVIFKSMKSMIIHAEKARGDLEEQYRLLILAGELANLMRKKGTFTVWSRDTANSSLFKANYEKIVEDASKLQSVLKIKYENAQVRQDKKDRAAAHEAEKRAVVSSVPATMRALRALIAPRELIRRVEGGDDSKKGETKKSALIFDLRENQSDAIFYDRSEMVTVIQVPYDLIDSSLTFQTLRTNLGVSQRTLLARLSNYDYVVLMDDENPELVNNSPAPKTKMSFLFKALTQYNQSERPKERPMFMEGGFKLWKDQYPMYTKNEQPMSARLLPSDDLDQVISAYHRYYSEVAEIRYPDLMLNPMRGEATPAQPVSLPKQPVIPPRPQIPPEPLQEPPKPGMGVYPTPSIPQRPAMPPFATTISQPPQFERPGPPIFSSAPTAVPKPIPPPQPPAPVFPIPDRTSKPTPLPERPIDPSSTPVDQRQNGGGDLRRPPLLDRGTKPANAIISKEDETPIISIYEQMTMAIERSIDERTRSRGPGGPGTVGLHNMGNTCFMSATLQCLFQTPGLSEVFTRRVFVSKVNTESRLGSKGVVSAGFASLVDTIWTGKYAAIRPARFLQLFADEVYRALNDGRQHDASEFQIFLLDALHEDTNQAKRIGFEQNYRGGKAIHDEAHDFLKKHYQFSSSPVSRNLGSISVSEIRCLTCGESSATFEENTIVSVELKSVSSCSLDTCLRSHYSTTRLEGDSCWNCPKCKQPRVSTRTSKLWQLPPVLIIHLKRFVLYNGDYEKNTAAVTFEHARFDIRPYLHEAASTDKPFYKLYAMTLHNGRLNSGHYTAVASHLKNDRWHRYDDETVRPCDKFDVDPSLAYILFYKRC